jgi:hypothetical protein
MRREKSENNWDRTILPASEVYNSNTAPVYTITFDPATARRET